MVQLECPRQSNSCVSSISGDFHFLISCLTLSGRGVIIPIFFGIEIGITFTLKKFNGIGIGIDGIVSLIGFGSLSGIGSQSELGTFYRAEIYSLYVVW